MRIFSAFIVVTLYIVNGYGDLRIPMSTTDFFPNIKDNLTKVTWAHAVNDAKYLAEVLASDNIMMIEADVVLGTLIDDPTATVQPIMGHPPSNTSDLSLHQFLNTIDASNRSPNASMKGVKLDFKSIDVFERSLETVESLYDKYYTHCLKRKTSGLRKTFRNIKKIVEVQYPIWINADILPGPINSQTTPVDAGRFLKASKKFPAAMLSVGWTTSYGGDVTDGSYSDQHIVDMIATLRENDVQQSVTFPVRAGLAANSLTQIVRLLSETTGFESTLTIWSSEGDYVDVMKLKEVIYTCGLDEIYLDVPKDLADKMHL